MLRLIADLVTRRRRAATLDARERRRLIWVSGLAYSFTVTGLYIVWGTSAGMAAVAPIAGTGWLMGRRAGLVAGLVTVPLHTLLFNLADRGWNWQAGVVDSGVAVFATYVFVGAASGQLSIWASRAHQMENLLAAASDAVVAVDASQRILTFNGPAEEIFGFEASDVVGRPFSSLLAEGLHRDVAPRIAEFIAGSDPRLDFGTDGVEGRRASGEAFPVDVTLSRMWVAGAMGAVALVRDITERRRLEARMRETNERFRRAFENAPIGMALVGPDNARLLQVNEQFRSLLGYSDDELSNRSLHDFVHPDDAERKQEVVDAALGHDDDVYQLQARLVASGGDTIHAIVNGSVVRAEDGTPLHLVIQIVDISELRRANGRLRELLKSKDDLIAAVSHELRTPLTGVIGFAEVLMEAGEAIESEERVEMVDTILRQSLDLADIIDDLLVAARVKNNTLKVANQPTDLSVLAAQVLERWEAALNAGVVFDGGSAVGMGDPTRVRQILRNLITNAIRYGGPSIHIEAGETDGHSWLQVRDDGDGIPDAEQERVFEAYYRSEDAPGLTGAVGLGLNISRTLAKLMKGDLTYRRDDGWTVFRLQLPPGADEPAPAVPADPRVVQSRVA